MDNSHLLDTKTVNSNEVLGNGKKYFVPTFQRDYSWKQDQWEDLWADILVVAASETVHYMGAIVLQNQGNKNFALIDGQQRLTTITLIALACIQKIKSLAMQQIAKEANEERVQLLSTKFIGDKDPSSLTYFSKLKLNENNDSFFQTYLLTFRKPATTRNLKDSNRLLWNAYDFFGEKINQYFEKDANGAAIAHFLNDRVAERLLFIQIIVENELRAYTVFETLNARGVGLTVTDLLKNYLFSLASKTDLYHVRMQWDRIVDTVGLDTFPTFLRDYWVARNPFVRQAHLYKKIRSQIQNYDDLFNLLDDLEKNVLLYVGLNNSADELWQGKKELKKRIKELEIFQAKQGLPLLLITYEKLPHLFEKVAKMVTVISFRATVIGGYHSGKLEEVYHKAALKIAQGELRTAVEIAKAIQELHWSDTDFKNDFATIALNTRSHKKLIRYILFELENQFNNSGAGYDFEENSATIEHILPENASATWESFFPKNRMENYVFRIGNYTLLESGKNNALGNKAYEEKLAVYKTSIFKSTAAIDYPEWNAHNLDTRQITLAKMATVIWKLPYY